MFRRTRRAARLLGLLLAGIIEPTRSAPGREGMTLPNRVHGTQADHHSPEVGITVPALPVGVTIPGA